ncbi:MAG: PspC domain-containing protein [Propionibacteriaceae bacterium]
MSSIWTIRRSATDQKLTGLCGGIARHWGVDPVLVRVGAVLLALSGGIGVVLYAAGWLLIPIDGKNDARIHDLIGEQGRRWPREAWIAIVAVACIAVFAIFGSVTPFGVGPAVILALIWYFGYYKNRRPAAKEANRTQSSVAPAPSVPASPPPSFFTYPGPPTPFTEAADAWRNRIQEAQRAAEPSVYRGIYDQSTPAPAASYRPSAVEEDVREPVGPASTLPPANPLGAESMDYHTFLAAPDPVGLYTETEVTTRTAPSVAKRGASRSARRLRLVSLVVLGLTLSGLALADNQGVDVPVAAYFAATLLVLGLTLVAAAWFGRARGILPVALLVLLATLGTSIGGPVASQQGFGTKAVSYTTVAQLAPGDHHDRGELKVDLSRLPATADATYTASVDMGLLEVKAPKNMNVVVKWQVDSGAIDVAGTDPQFGKDRSGVTPVGTPDPRKKTLTLNLSVDQGYIEVTS